MATNSDVLDLGMSRLTKRSSTVVRADLLKEINATIERLERGTFLPWFLQSLDTLSIVADETSKALDTNFLREEEESRPYYTLDGTVYYLEKRLFAVLQHEAPTTVKYYAIRGTTFHFKKAADQAYTITVPIYVKSNDPLTDDSDAVSNLWLLNAQDWVLYAACKTIAATVVRDADLARDLAALEREAKIDLYNYHESIIHTNQDYFVGGASDGS